MTSLHFSSAAPELAVMPAPAPTFAAYDNAAYTHVAPQRDADTHEPDWEGFEELVVLEAEPDTAATDYGPSCPVHADRTRDALIAHAHTSMTAVGLDLPATLEPLTVTVDVAWPSSASVLADCQLATAPVAARVPVPVPGLRAPLPFAPVKRGRGRPRKNPKPAGPGVWHAVAVLLPPCNDPTRVSCFVGPSFWGCGGMHHCFFLVRQSRSPS